MHDIRAKYMTPGKCCFCLSMEGLLTSGKCGHKFICISCYSANILARSKDMSDEGGPLNCFPCCGFCNEGVVCRILPNGFANVPLGLH